jgi:glycosyltransferase involved in cell wall biosynthesis
VPVERTSSKPIVCLATTGDLIARSWIVQDVEILKSMPLRVNRLMIGSPLPDPFALLASLTQLKSILSSRAIFAWFAYPTTWFLGKAFGKPIIANAVGYEVALDPDFILGLPSWWYARALIGIALRRADYVIAISKESARWAERWGARDVVIIHEGISTTKFKPTMRHLPEGQQIVLTAAYLSGPNIVRKDFATLLLAMKRVVDALPKAKLIIVGEKMDGFPILAKAARELGMTKAITFTGFISFDQYMKILRNASVFAMPSLQEGFPTALCEALSCGVPIVTTNRPAMNEVFTDNKDALMVRPKDPERLADAIMSLLTDKHLANKIADNGRKLVEEKYSTEIRAKKLIQLFRTVLAVESTPTITYNRLKWTVIFICLCIITPLAMLLRRLLKTSQTTINLIRHQKTPLCEDQQISQIP